LQIQKQLLKPATIKTSIC